MISHWEQTPWWNFGYLLHVGTVFSHVYVDRRNPHPPWITALSWQRGLCNSEAWVGGGLLQGWGHWACGCMGPFEGGRCYLHYLHHSLVSGQTTRREHGPAHQQKIRLQIYWAWPHPSEQDPVSPSQSLQLESFHKPLIFIHQRTGRMKTTITEN